LQHWLSNVALKATVNIHLIKTKYGITYNKIYYISGTGCVYAKLLAEPVYEPWCTVLFGFKNSNIS